MQTNKQKQWIAIFLSVAVVAIVVVFSLRSRVQPPKPNLLLPKATRIVVSENWGGPFTWVSNSELLFTKFSRDKYNNNIVNGMVLLNTANGSEQPLAALNAQFSKSFIDPHDQILSPDGKWLIGDEPVSGAAYSHTFDGSRQWVTTLEGKHQIRWHDQHIPREFGPTQWLPNSQGWIVLTGKMFFPKRNTIVGSYGIPTDVYVYSVKSPQTPRRVKVKDLPKHTYLVGVLSDQHALFFSNERWLAPEQNIQFWNCNLEGQTARLHSYTLSMKGFKAFRGPVLSPTGDQLAWIATKKYKEMGLWTSDIYGKHWREIGHIPDKSDRNLYQIMSLNWLPDGKHLSFWYDRALYTVPTT